MTSSWAKIEEPKRKKKKKEQVILQSFLAERNQWTKAVGEESEQIVTVKGCIDRIRSGWSKEIYSPHNGLGFQERQISLPTLPFLYLLHRSSLTFISRVYAAPILLRPFRGTPAWPWRFGQVIPRDDFENAIPLPFLLLRDRASVSEVIKRSDKCN